MDYSAIKPFIDIFSRSQFQTILIAWLPTKLSPYLTGIIAVDMFVTTVIASGLSTLFYLIYVLFSTVLFGKSNAKNSICIQIDYYTLGPYNERINNIIYESLSWLISEQTKKLQKGSFILSVLPNLNSREKNTIPKTSILPINDQEIPVEIGKKTFNIKYRVPNEEDNKKNDKNFSPRNYYYPPIFNFVEKPSIYITSKEKSETLVDDISYLLRNITQNYLEYQKKNSGRFRYENYQDRWQKIAKISSCRGLNSIALDEQQENLLKKELDTFVNNKEFYARTGMPYRRGLLLYGKPGTGKTTLINAISSYLSRDIYNLNLKMIKDDNELSATFSTVPPNQIIVLEDVDTQSIVLHKRNGDIKKNFIEELITVKDNLSNDKEISNENYLIKFSLSTFLACLDGHKISEGNIIIMTTNYLDVLDPACVRPGRMDIHLELGYCTHYQLNKLFKIIINDGGMSEQMENELKTIPEKLLPPCEVTTLMLLYHNDPEKIVINKLRNLAAKYKINNEVECINKKRKLEIL
jgi:SpoVK/Ycf46/Vps4 family AAA+-type ATPase